jgi:hypothetical protein
VSREQRRRPETPMPTDAQLQAMGFVRCRNAGCTCWIEPANVPGPVRCPHCTAIVNALAGGGCPRCERPLEGAEPIRRCSEHHVEWVRERRKRASGRSESRVALPDRHRRQRPRRAA